MPKAAQKPELNINLMADQEKSKPSVNNFVGWTLNIGRILVIVAEIIAIAIFAISIKLATDKQSLKESIGYLSGQVKSQQEFENEFRTVQNRINQVSSNQANQVFSNLVLKEFLSLLPKGMTLENYKYNDGTIEFEGLFKSPKELQTLISSFTASNKIVGLNISKLEHPNESHKEFLVQADAIVITSEFKEK